MNKLAKKDKYKLSEEDYAKLEKAKMFVWMEKGEASGPALDVIQLFRVLPMLLASICKKKHNSNFFC
ncbi:hypothetical protein [Saccharococcus thermophilus]|uniref:Uncharacterized protein n=1 Tax=Saccharococcus thermophilus TaxID=29396 RepID=A0A846MCY5_9BACL|nr:hypothetical protein [Saccharococcus thermophilus]NIK14337.1 hypothetical protein [Saccharococcus thermophilus]